MRLFKGRSNSGWAGRTLCALGIHRFLNPRYGQANKLSATYVYCTRCGKVKNASKR